MTKTLHDQVQCNSNIKFQFVEHKKHTPSLCTDESVHTSLKKLWVPLVRIVWKKYKQYLDKSRVYIFFLCFVDRES